MPDHSTSPLTPSELSALEPRPKRAVAGTSLICTACGCRWKKHAPCDVFPNGSLQLYDADQRPCAQCDNASTVPLRPEMPNDQKDDSA